MRTERNGKTFVESAINTLKDLPPQFQVLSISGGEPTLSPVLLKFLLELNRLRRTRKFQRVVLTTNGAMFADNIDEVKLRIILSAVDHINISRHAVDDEQNYEIFRTRSVPSTEQLAHAIRTIRDMGNGAVDVTLNCVHDEDVSTKFCRQFVKYAKDVGANAVSFRKTAGVSPIQSIKTSTALLKYHKKEGHVAPCKAELKFVEKYGKGRQSKCPVCRGRDMDVDGFPVRWKGSATEPSIVTGGIYELVINSDGLVYADWDRRVPVNMNSLNAWLNTRAMAGIGIKVNGPGGGGGSGRTVRVYQSKGSGGGCGSGGCGPGSC